MNNYEDYLKGLNHDLVYLEREPLDILTKSDQVIKKNYIGH